MIWMEVLTGNRFSDYGGMVMRVITRVEIMVMQGSMYPVIEELHRTCMKQTY